MDEHNVPTHMGVSLGHEKGGGADTKGTDLEYTMLSERHWTHKPTRCAITFTRRIGRWEAGLWLSGAGEVLGAVTADAYRAAFRGSGLFQSPPSCAITGKQTETGRGEATCPHPW